MAANARGSATHTATRRRAHQDGTLRPEWQCPPHGTARSGPSGSAAHTATRHRAYQDGALRPEWQCPPHGTARSGPSGSAAHTATRRRACGLHALTLPLDVERTEDVALPLGDLVRAGAVALSRVVPGHPCFVEEAPDAWPPSSSPPCVHLRCHAAGMSATNTTRGLPAKVPSADTRGVLRSGSPPAPPRRLSTAFLSWLVASTSRDP